MGFERVTWSGIRESNPRLHLGKVAYYHYTNPAINELHQSVLNVFAVSNGVASENFRRLVTRDFHGYVFWCLCFAEISSRASPQIVNFYTFIFAAFFVELADADFSTRLNPRPNANWSYRTRRRPCETPS
jgi:hypothetical protein